MARKATSGGDDEKSRRFKDVGVRLKAAREALELSAAELCRRAKIPPNNYGNWEGGFARPSVDAAQKLADQLGVTLDYIYKGDMRGLPYSLTSKMNLPRH